ncbi:hypothetical protein IFR05_004632, partial [Cadophora sp. M221]
MWLSKYSPKANEDNKKPGVKYQAIPQRNESHRLRDQYLVAQSTIYALILLGALTLFELGFLGFNTPINSPSRPSPQHSTIPPPPTPEPITITRLTLPPVVSEDKPGACSTVNPNKTGCIPIDSSLQSGNFLPDNKHVLAAVTFAGAPPSPDPGSIFTGRQIILLKIDESVFPNGASWKCVTCGVPVSNQPARNWDDEMGYPQAFKDGKRILAGSQIIDCGDELLQSVG